MTDPVCKLVKALYGHPNSGSYWEARCHEKVVSEGFELIGDSGEWRSRYVHKELGVMFVIYVDDFKMGGPEENGHICWKAQRYGSDAIQMDDPTTIEVYFGLYSQNVSFEVKT